MFFFIDRHDGNFYWFHNWFGCLACGTSYDELSNIFSHASMMIAAILLEEDAPVECSGGECSLRVEQCGQWIYRNEIKTFPTGRMEIPMI